MSAILAPAVLRRNTRSRSSISTRVRSTPSVTSKPIWPSAFATARASLGGLGSTLAFAYLPLPMTSARWNPQVATRCIHVVMELSASIERPLRVAAVQREGGNLDFEMLAVGAYHAVGAHHEARRRLQRHAAGIFERFAGLKNRLL